jgi:hypothetical protein
MALMAWDKRSPNLAEGTTFLSMISEYLLP